MARSVHLIILVAALLLGVAVTTSAQPKGPKESNEPKVPNGPKETKEPKVPNAPKETEEPNGPKETEEPKVPNGPKETEEPKVPNGPKEMKEPKVPNGPKETKEPKEVKCPNGGPKVNLYCRGVRQYCPSRCPQSCTIDCEYTCKPVCVCDKPGACGDPQFIGGDGNSFFFHGRKDRDFCIVSDSDLHINAHFIGKRSPSMTRDFTWIQAIGVLFGEHRLYIGAKKTATWDNESDHLEISFDGEYIHLPETDGAEWKSLYVPALKISRTKTVNTVVVGLKGRFKIVANVVPITKEDSRIHNYGVTSDNCLAHLDLAFKFDVLTSDVHGVLGQTYRPDYVNRFDVTKKMPTLGGESKYATSGLFSTNCVVARFGRGSEAAELITNLADVKCASGMDGPGVVCKK